MPGRLDELDADLRRLREEICRKDAANAEWRAVAIKQLQNATWLLSLAGKEIDVLKEKVHALEMNAGFLE